MYSTKTSLASRHGLNSKLASDIAKIAKSFESKITLTVPDSENTANAKSVSGILSLGLENDCEITVTANGDDEEEAANAVAEMISSKGE